MTIHFNSGDDRLVSAELALLDADPDRDPAASGINPIFEGAPLGFHPLGYTRLDDAMPEPVDEGYTRNPDDEKDEDDTPLEGMGVSPLALTLALGQRPPAPAPAPEVDPAAARLAVNVAINTRGLVPELGLPLSLPTAVNAEDLPEGVELGASSGRDLPLLPQWRTGKGDLKRAGIPQVHRDEVNHCVNLLATNFVMAADADPEVWTSVSRSEDWWGKRQGIWPEWATYTYMRAALAVLTEAGYAEERRAIQGEAHFEVWQDENGKTIQGRQSRYRATPKLIAAMRGVNRFHHEVGDNVIRCRRRDGTPVAVRQTDRVERLASPIHALNKFLAGHEVELVTQDPTCTLTRSRILIDRINKRTGRPTKQFVCPSPAVTLFRSFCRGVLTRGGRVYWWGQALPEDLRGQLLIDGEATVEFDFKALHPRLLYAERGLPMDFDPYQVDGFPAFIRDHWKLALLVAVNAPGGRKGIAKALLKKNATGDWPHDEVTTYRAIEALAKRNAPIAAQFGRDRGVALMRVDSDLIVRIMVRCRKLGIVALPVHDSLIVPVSQADTVEAIMHEEFERISGGFPVVVDRKVSRRNVTGIPSLISSTSSENPLQALPPSSSFPDTPEPSFGTSHPLGGDNPYHPETSSLGSDSLERLSLAKLPEVPETVRETVPVEECGPSQVSLMEAPQALPESLPAPRPVNAHSFALYAKAKALQATSSSPASSIADLKAGNRPCEAPVGASRPGRRPAPRKAVSEAALAIGPSYDDYDLPIEPGYRYVPEPPEPKVAEADMDPRLALQLRLAREFNAAGRTSVRPTFRKAPKWERDRWLWQPTRR